MIQANELRIGNLVNFKLLVLGKDNYCPVTCIKPKDCVVAYKGNDLVLPYGAPDLQPIPITHEILEKCGFNRGMLWNEFQINQQLRFYADIDETKCHLFDKQDNNLGEAHYLHQLQNLYFALTGLDLTLNL